jgi:hypothetical protein
VYEPTSGGLPSREVQALAVTARGQVWAGTGGPYGDAGRGAAVLDPARDGWTLYSRATAGPGFGFDNVTGIALDPSLGHVWLTSQGKPACPTPSRANACPDLSGAVSRLVGSEWRSWSRRGDPPAPALADIGAFTAVVYDASPGAQRVWVGGWHGQPNFHWNDGTGLDATVNSCPRSCQADGWTGTRFPGDGAVRALAVDSQGRLWAGGHRNGAGAVPPVGGLRILTGEVWSVHTSELTPLPSDDLTAFAPAGASMWVGTLAAGAIRWLPPVLDRRSYLPRAAR